MIAFGAFAVLRPLWLLVLPALLALLRFTRRRETALGDWGRAVDAPLLAFLLRGQAEARDTSRDGPIYWAVVLIALALSGPAVKSAGAGQFRNLDAMLLLLDVSKGDSLPQVTATAQLLLESGGARQKGLVLYAGDAYLASPLTDDGAALESLLFAVDDKTVPDGGTRPDRAIAFARRVLRDAGAFSGDVALVSDGAGVDAATRAEAAALAAEGHSLHTLLVAPRGAGRSDASGRPAMTALAADGRGLAGDAARAGDVAQAIASRRIERVEQGARRALEWQDCGRWLLAVAAAPLLLFFRRRRA
jgi:Ca-activated chloride channel family protein